MIKRLVIQTAFMLLAFAILLFPAAGTLAWPQAWVLIVEFAVLSLAVGFWLARYNPALLRERMGSVSQDGQMGWDKIFLVFIMVLWCVWFVVMGLERRMRGEGFALPWQGLGVLCIAFSIYTSYRIFRENSFAAPVVKIQRERSQTVITTGPYSLVRHPMYAGASFMFLGIPLLLGSWWGLVIAPLFFIGVAVRSVLEERVLETELEGYADYKRTVRYRMIPYVW
jgi:protein-S-isoprenylcysteine O-methyltransferase Ste14